ncbi:MAG: chorismate mutase, partial [Muribaculaceae bacterium]|nr:chorismate mutase [Muribaculaceae bacterium]
PLNGAKPESTESLTLLRQEIDNLDNELLEILGKRMRICREIGTYKKEHGMKVVQGARYSDMMKSREALAREMEMGDEFIRRIYSAIHEESVRQQVEIFKKK